ncbi:hypothetical protein ACUHMQ_20565, partial [Chitinimonas sp. PSY-7]|uniref:hypothetical protein n=1 Tax=Chitinimonas sp. PSY-7 TaxID=3459088 RepID=UPI0040400F56
VSVRQLVTGKSIFGDVLGNSIAGNGRNWVGPAKPVVPEPNRSERPRDWRDLFVDEVVPAGTGNRLMQYAQAADDAFAAPYMEMALQSSRKQDQEVARVVAGNRQREARTNAAQLANMDSGEFWGKMAQGGLNSLQAGLQQLGRGVSDSAGAVRESMASGRGAFTNSAQARANLERIDPPLKTFDLELMTAGAGGAVARGAVALGNGVKAYGNALMQLGTDAARYGVGPAIGLNLGVTSTTTALIGEGLYAAGGVPTPFGAEVSAAGVATRGAVGPAAGVHPDLWAAVTGGVNQPAITRALRQSGSAEGAAVAKLLKRGNVELEVSGRTLSIPQGGEYFPGTNKIVVYEKYAGDAKSAAGLVAHETEHFLQGLTARQYANGATALQAELGAYAIQRRVDRKFFLQTDDSVMKYLVDSPLYPHINQSTVDSFRDAGQPYARYLGAK